MHVCGISSIKHSFVEIYQVFLELRKHLRGQAVQHMNTHSVNANTSGFMYVQFAFLHILVEKTLEDAEHNRYDGASSGYLMD